MQCRQIPKPRPHTSTCYPRRVLRMQHGLAVQGRGSLVASPAHRLRAQVDTAFVGQTSNVALAALGPNTAIFNFVFQVRTRRCRPRLPQRAWNHALRRLSHIAMRHRRSAAALP